MIALQISSPWNVCTPTLFRFLEKQFVDQFFQDGTLRLSTFDKFKKHEDEQRLGKQEGKITFVHRTSQRGGQTLEAFAAHGQNAYVLCGAMRFENELMDAFNCDSYIRINDPTKFGMAISKHLPGFIAGFEGPCLYQANKIIEKDLGYIDLNSFKTQTGQVDMNKLQSFINHHMSFYPYFLKDKSYSHQMEYRLLWLTSSETNDYIDIKAPEAIQFCSMPSNLTE
jgi:hypothetical protein